MEEYLGDGLYVSLEGNMIKLRAPRYDGDHWVGLEPIVFLELCRFAKERGFKDILQKALK